METVQTPKNDLDSAMADLLRIARMAGDFERRLPRVLDPLALSRAKIPFKALSSREALMWRFTEQLRDACDAFVKERLGTAITLTRASVETTAAMWHLWRRVEACIERDELNGFDEYITRLSLGTRTMDELPQAISVLTFIDKVSKELPGFRAEYERLSEFAHPNWGGTVGLYCKHDHDNIMVFYGRNVRENSYPFIAGIANLATAADLFKHSYNELADLMPQFVKLCEREIKDNGANGDSAEP